MKKLNVFANVLICSSLGLWIMKALLDYNNYTRHVELFKLPNGGYIADTPGFSTFDILSIYLTPFMFSDMLLGILTFPVGNSEEYCYDCR